MFCVFNGEFVELAPFVLNALSGEHAVENRHEEQGEDCGEGVFIILWLTGHTLNVMSMIGAIMLIGIVVKNGFLMPCPANTQ